MKCNRVGWILNWWTRCCALKIANHLMWSCHLVTVWCHQAAVRLTSHQELVKTLLSHWSLGMKKATGEEVDFHFVKAGPAGQIKKGKWELNKEIWELGHIWVFTKGLLFQQMLKLCGQKIKSSLEKGYSIPRVMQDPPSMKSLHSIMRILVCSVVSVLMKVININLTLVWIFSCIWVRYVVSGLFPESLQRFCSELEAASII